MIKFATTGNVLKNENVYLKDITLTHFKNYTAQSVRFSPHLNCFVGLNGMGKTNLLDAIYYCCIGKSYFAGSDRNLVQQGSEGGFFRLEAAFCRQDKLERVVVKVIPGKRKEIARNQVVYTRISEHLGLLPVVMIAPFDVRLALEGSEARRKFLDATLSQLQPAYLQQLIQYNRLLQQRNALLKRFAEQRSFDATLLRTYDAQLVPLGQFIYTSRKTFLEEFQSTFQHYYRLIASEQEQVDYRYLSKLDHYSFEDLLQGAVEKDRVLQRTTVGIHKDDIDFRINRTPVKRFASQGQLKSFILALKLAQYQLMRQHKGLPPILLLDDIFDKLDQQRVQQLLQLLLEQDFGQIFITDTDEHRVQQIVQAFDKDY
ncbi:MAG: DNA replication and repair protein RecF, partial [Bacteroidota bacterium]